MRILLISPLDPDIPTQLRFLMGGENTYTRLLIKNPPVGVTFIHFEVALKQHLISYHWSHQLFLFLQKLRILPLGPRVQAFTLHERFDLVYAHAYPVKLVGKRMPIVISESSSNDIFLRLYLKQSALRIRCGQFIKKILFKSFKVVDAEVNSHSAASQFVFSKWAAEYKLANQNTAVKVLYPGLSIPKSIHQFKSDTHVRFLFVGVWFERKGGRILLDAYRQLARKYQTISLTILGEIPTNIKIDEHERITQKDFVTYKELLQTYQKHDVLVHIPYIEGYGMAVVEAMSYGLCPIVSAVCALQEFVTDGKTGLVVVPGNTEELKRAMEKVISDAKARKKYGQESRHRFITHFSLPVFSAQLRQLFVDSL